MKNFKTLLQGAAIAGFLIGSLAAQAWAKGGNAEQLTEFGSILHGDDVSSANHSCNGNNESRGNRGRGSGDNECKCNHFHKGGKGGSPKPISAAE